MNRERFDAIKAKITAHKEKATDMDILVNAIKELPYGQLKKVLTEEAMEVLTKYGYSK